MNTELSIRLNTSTRKQALSYISLLFRFLKDKNSFSEFIDETFNYQIYCLNHYKCYHYQLSVVREDNRASKVAFVMEYLLYMTQSHYDFSLIIDRALQWDTTKRGREYWKTLNIEFGELFKKTFLPSNKRLLTHFIISPEKRSGKYNEKDKQCFINGMFNDTFLHNQFKKKNYQTLKKDEVNLIRERNESRHF